MSGRRTYVAGSIYSPHGEVEQYSLGVNLGTENWQTFDYEEGTRRLSRMRVDRAGHSQAATDARYTHDPAGNPVNLADTGSQAGAGDVQCFTYDHLRRVSDAWAQTSSTCASGAAAASLGGPAPYGQSYSYDLAGNRTELVDHHGGVTTTYAYPSAGQVGPHTLSSVVTDGPGGSTLTSYSYDAAGNTVGVSRPTSSSSFGWDVEGRLGSVTTPDGVSEFVYTADGDRLIRRDPDATTLYFFGTELRLDHGTGTVSGTRYYEFNGAVIAMREGANDIYTLGVDLWGTPTSVINNAGNQVQTRRSDPFGVPRGAQPSVWPGDRGFHTGTVDQATGLVHMGARFYEPLVGRFLSVDPVIDHFDSEQIHGYAYANNNPLAFTDPSGLFLKSAAKALGGAAKSAANAVAGGVAKAAQATADFAVNTVQTIKEDPWKFAAEVAVGVAVAVAVGALCAATAGVGCVIVAGVVAGAASAGVGYGMDVGRGKREFSAKDLATEMAVGAAVGGLTAGAGKFVPKGGRTSVSCPVGNSFLPGTAVAMADGSHQPIEDIQLGDLVLATDPETGVQGPRTVTATIIGDGDKQLVEVTAAGATVTATDAHPFWVVDLDGDGGGVWVDAVDLQPGDLLLASDGQPVAVTAVATYEATATVHNLTIEDIHTYHIAVGDTDTLVHNCNGIVASNQSVAQNRAAITAHKHDGFSGVYDPVSDTFHARVSRGPHALVSDRGGHRQINHEVYNGSRQTVGFSITDGPNGVLQLRWNSVSVNRRHFGDRAAPQQYRPAIADAVRRATGLNVAV
jgi:RHS repeat-associated protein